MFKKIAVLMMALVSSSLYCLVSCSEEGWCTSSDGMGNQIGKPWREWQTTTAPIPQPRTSQKSPTNKVKMQKPFQKRTPTQINQPRSNRGFDEFSGEVTAVSSRKRYGQFIR